MPDFGLSPHVLLLAAFAFLVAGFVKGVVGGGLPAIAVPIMATSLDPATAAALTLVSVIATNIWLLAQGGLFLRVMKRYWPFLGMLAIGCAIGSQILVAVRPEIMKLAMGALVVVLSPLPFLPQRFAVPPAWQPWLNPLAGLVFGIIGGATVMLAPVIIYFVALRIEKDLFVASMGAVALSSMTPLFIGLAASRVLGPHELMLSALAFLPAALGMTVGVWLRGRISQRHFQIVLSVALLAIGLNLVSRNFGAVML
ncbi:MAG: sulfite exporter TauE/SafE family protein [Hyphomicrobiaceae bacterium]